MFLPCRTGGIGLKSGIRLAAAAYATTMLTLRAPGRFALPFMLNDTAVAHTKQALVSLKVEAPPTTNEALTWMSAHVDAPELRRFYVTAMVG